MTLFDFFILKILFAKLAGFNISAFPPSLFIAFTKLADVIFGFYAPMLNIFLVNKLSFIFFRHLQNHQIIALFWYTYEAQNHNYHCD